jgi:hypothetical protein
MLSLWDVRERGMPVYVHQLDVALLCLERAEDRSDVDLSVVLLGALIHDASKAPWDRGTSSHSLLMRTNPEPAADASMSLLGDAEERSGVPVDEATRAHVRHVVLSHHGTHGLVQPGTAEARLVAVCDYMSSTEHRLAPIDANDILPLLVEGYTWPRAAAMLGVDREIVKSRLREACRAEGVREWVELVPIWRRRGTVFAGPPERHGQIARAREVTRLARQVPESLLERVAACAGAVATPLG